MYNSKSSGLVQTFDIEDANPSKNSWIDQIKDNHFFKAIFTKQSILGCLVVLALILIYITSSSSNDETSMKFQKWKAQYAPNSKMSPEENHYRFQIFKTNVDIIKQHNAQKDVSYQMGINQFAIYTADEFRQTYLMANFAQNYALAETESITNGMKTSPNVNSHPLIVKATSNINWQTQGKITAVKNQGACGSCYSFATVGLIQNKFLRLSNLATDLSQQQLVDCTAGYGNVGCNGGNILNSLYYILANINATTTIKVGITSQSIYPYRGNYGACSSLGGNYKISGGYYYTGCNNIIFGLQTSAVGLYVDATDWPLYSNGIFTGCAPVATINHAVLLVGVSNGTWIIKNSWGNTWGQNGFIRLPAGNSCGICTYSGFTTY